MTRDARRRKYVHRTAGVVLLAVLASLAALSVAVYNKEFTESVIVTLRTDRIGNQLNPQSEVKARGVVVGEVRQVNATPEGADITLALDPRSVGRLPRDVSALLVPKTLFGERYVQLSIPDGAAKPALAQGDVISQDRSANAIELEKVFSDLLPVLKAVQPQKLATTLTAVATALDGRGEQLGDTLVTAAGYLEEFNPHLPDLNRNVADLARVSQLYGDIAPDLLDALTDSATSLRTVAEKHGELSALYPAVGGSARDLTRFLEANRHNLIRLAVSAREPLEVAARYSPSFPCTLKAMTDLKPAMDKALGVGTDEPGLHIRGLATESRGKYLPGVDDPVFDAAGGPRCYPSGVAPADTPATAAPAAVAPPAAPGSGGLGLPNSPQEQELVATIAGAQLGKPAGAVPAWGSVLLGPLYRGAEVELR
ncbi:MCE family protein [Amycolatopsis suaedae]|uniref:MCE family protein n=1 Tax=Amycolatopsis suaedae TaxID=2510978 RepID=A0A4Q7JCG9_9PSEU|nr:MCE family protein [Amycolatopsis suaedae]RZQ64732.1 MCE family protein [Amycolatopsis suaedae]